MLRQFLLSDPGEGLEEAEIIAWRVSEGDEVQVNDVLVEVETSKSLVELPSPWAGTVKRLLAAEGQVVEVGSSIAEIEDGADEAPEPNLVGYGPAAEQTPRRRRRGRGGTGPENSNGVRQALSDAYEPHEPGRPAEEQQPPQAVRAEPVGDPLPEPGQGPSESQLVLASSPDGVRAKPPVRKYAQDLGVDLRFVTGTGIGGTITRADVEAAAAFRSASRQGVSGRIVNDQASFQQNHQRIPGSEAGDFGGFGSKSDPFEGRSERRIPIKGVRKATAENVKRSVAEHVHVTEWTTIDVTATMELVEMLKRRNEFQGLRISPLLVYAKAICLALGRNPDLNSSWDEENQEIVYHADVNLGIAAATPRGLMVPNIKKAQKLNLLELTQAINHLVAVSREGSLQPADYSGGTFTITNVGVFGIDAGTPVINGQESGIFCMGSIDRRPWVVGTGADERVEPRWVTTLALSFDHRNVDGEQGSKFLADVASILSDPAQALLF